MPKKPETQIKKTYDMTDDDSLVSARQPSLALSKKDIKASFGIGGSNPPGSGSGSCKSKNYVPGVVEAYQSEYKSQYSDEDGCDLMLDRGDLRSSNQELGVFKMQGKPLTKERPLMADTAPSLPALPEDIDLLRKEICFERVAEKVYVNVVAIDKKNMDKNVIQSIRANGDPLGGYAYTTETDHYLIGCCDYCPIGIIPMAFRLSVPGYAGKQLIPLPDSLIFKHAAPQQRKMIRVFKEKNLDCDIQFVQALSRS